MDNEVLSSIISGVGAVLAALIIGVAGSLITRHYARERDRQDRESQWRQHAIELTKLDLERKLKAYDPKVHGSLRPTILDFLANYRDLQELGELSPKELYVKIKNERIKS